MSTASNEVNIAFICDNNYIMPTGVAIHSMIQNMEVDHHYHIYVLCENVSEEAMHLTKSMTCKNVEISILDLGTSEKYRDFGIDNFHVSTAAAYKFDLPNIFPELDKLLYLDSDILIQADLFSLYSIDLSNHYAAVVKDVKAYTFGGDFRSRLGITHRSYFNSGMLLLNLKKMREERISEKLHLYRQHGKNKYMDQDAFNVVFADNVKYINFKFNASFSNLDSLSSEELKQHDLELSESVTQEALCNQATILHFSSQIKPWDFFNIPCADRWFQSFLNSPFSHLKLDRKSSNVKRNYWKMEFSPGMNYTPRISVIIPVYNAQRVLRESIDSVLSQSFLDFELICVDDGSSDASLEILHAYANQDPRVIVITQKNQYAGVARNNGMRIAKGEYITFLDSDDKFAEDALERFYEEATATNADVVISETYFWDGLTRNVSPGAWGVRAQYRPSKKVFSRADAPQFIFNLSSGNPWGKVYKRSLIERNQIEFLDIKRSEDFYFVFLAFALAERISTIEEPLIYYRANNYGGLEMSKDDAPLLFWEANCRLKETLIKLGMFDDLTKQSLINSELNQFIYTLNKVGTSSAYNVIFDFFKQIHLTELELGQHDDSYFFTVNVKKIRTMLQSPSADAFMPAGLINDSVLCQEACFEHNQPYAIKVSVIIPVYNAQEYLFQALSSITKQTLSDIEIICVNDRSTDNSLQILQEFAAADNRITVINQTNGKQSRARNNGMARAKGEYVYFFDSDDVLEVDALKNLYDYANAKGLQLLLFNGISFFETEELKKKFPHYEWIYQRKGKYYDVYLGEELFSDMIRNGDYTVSPCLQFIKRSYLVQNNIRFRDGITHEDNLFSFQVILSAKRAGYLEQTLFHRRVRANSTVTKKNSYSDFQGLYTCLVCMILHSVQHEWNNETLDHAKRYLRNFFQTVQKYYQMIPVAERKEPGFNNRAESIVSQFLYCGLSENHGSAGTSRNNSNNNSAAAELELMKIRSSFSFRLGRFLTFVPRKLRGGIRCYREHGLNYTLRRFKEKMSRILGGNRP